MKRMCLLLGGLSLAVLLVGCGASQEPASQTASPTTTTVQTQENAISSTTSFVDVPMTTPTTDEAVEITQTLPVSTATAVVTMTTQKQATDDGTLPTTTASSVASVGTTTRPTGEPEIDFSEFE